MKKVNFYGVGLNLLDTTEALMICDKYFNGNDTKTIFFLNAHYYNLSAKTKDFRDKINASSLMLNDGIGVKIGLKLKGIEQKENMNGTDFIPKIIELARDKSKKVYLLGAKEGISAKAAINLKKTYEGLQIAGYRNGYFNDKEEADIINNINDSGAELLIIGMGAPYQEEWINRNKHKLDNVKIIVSGGAILDFISGEVTRAPKWIRKINMEWAYRLFLEPRRLFNRYMIGNFKFFLNLLSNRNDMYEE